MEQQLTALPSSNLEFLSTLKENNNREWFEANRGWYERELAHIKAFTQSIVTRMQAHDQIEKLKLYRIYRDIRFSKDKTPYKTGWSGSMSRATQQLRGGYYFAISPDQGLVGGGFYNPNKEDMKLIRDKIAVDDQPLRTIIADPTFQLYFGELRGDKVKTAPKGFSKDHPAIDLIRHKQFVVRRLFTQDEILDEGFLDQIIETYLAVRPFFDYMSEVLTTDMNGVPLYED